MEIVEGTVIAMHGPLVRVQVAEDTLVVASRRRLNWEGGTPAAARLVVGDRVAVEMQGSDGVIVAVHARRNSLLRPTMIRSAGEGDDEVGTFTLVLTFPVASDQIWL